MLDAMEIAALLICDPKSNWSALGKPILSRTVSIDSSNAFL